MNKIRIIGTILLLVAMIGTIIYKQNEYDENIKSSEIAYNHKMENNDDRYIPYVQSYDSEETILIYSIGIAWFLFITYLRFIVISIAIGIKNMYKEVKDG